MSRVIALWYGLKGFAGSLLDGVGPKQSKSHNTSVIALGPAKSLAGFRREKEVDLSPREYTSGGDSVRPPP